jgi:hypothetical protein
MLREAKKMRTGLRASLEDARTRVANLETQNLDAKLEIDSLKASPVVSDEVECADCSIFLANLAMFKEKHASKCEEPDVLRVEVAELKSRSALLGACTSYPVLPNKIDEMHAYTVSLEAKLKEPIPTPCSTCEVHALKNLELAHYMDRLEDENDELRKIMGWLSGHEPQLRMMIEAYKRYDGQALGSEKVGESSGEGREKVGDIQAPPKTYHKNAYAPKSNPLRNKLDTTPDPPIFPHPTYDFQKPIKFKSALGNVFFGKEGVKSSEEKPVEKPSGEKPNEQPHPKPKPKPIKFHYGYCGRDGHKGEFCFKKRREEKMAKEWANKDGYNPSHVVSESRMPLPRGKAIVRIAPAWGEKSATGGRGPAGGVKPVRPIWRQQGDQFGFRARDESRLVAGGHGSGGWSGEFAGGQFAMRSPLVLNTGMGGVVALRWRGGSVHDLPFVVLVLLQLERVGSLVVVTMVVIVEVALIGEMLWSVLTLLWSKWLDTGFTLLVLTPVLSHLFTHVLAFEFQVGDLKNIWLIDFDCLRHMTGHKGWFSSLVPVVTKRYITFGDNGRGRVLSEGEIKVSDKITLRHVALVQSLGYNLLSVSQLLDESFEVLFHPGGSRILDSRGDLVCMVGPEGHVFRADFSQSFGVERCFLAGFE